MVRMIRKQIYIEPAQDEILKQRAKDLGVSEAELIRRAIDQISRDPIPLTPDRKAWQEELEFMRQRRKSIKPLGGKRTWTREEIYEERFKKFLS